MNPAVYHIGPQKSATTWLYRCFQENPTVSVPKVDATHYFDMKSTNTSSWYHDLYEENQGGKIFLDFSPSYLRNPLAPELLYNENPDAKIILCAREPISRAFSHYWHEKRKNSINYKFEDVFGNYDLYSSWVETGFYSYHIKRYLSYFKPEQILVQIFDDLETDPMGFYSQACDFIGASTEHLPSTLNLKINQGLGIKRAQRMKKFSSLKKKIDRPGMKYFVKLSQLSWDTYRRLSDKSEVNDRDKENLEDIQISTLKKLHQVFEPWNRNLENFIDRPLPNNWYY